MDKYQINITKYVFIQFQHSQYLAFVEKVRIYESHLQTYGMNRMLVTPSLDLEQIELLCFSQHIEVIFDKADIGAAYY